MAEAWFTLARALWDAPAQSGRDRTRAVVLAEQARDGFGAEGETAAKRLEVEVWLRKHGPSERQGLQPGSHVME